MQTATAARAKARTKTPVETAHPADVQSLAGAGLRGFFGIVEKWGLSEKESLVLLGEPSRATYYNWKKGDAAKLTRDTLARLSYIVGIYKALRILIPNDDIAHAWVRNPNDAPLFAGQPPLALMLTGNQIDLYRVRAYLDANRGWA